ncbi:PadR family transcriptional regulator [candidate division GN15 bacterium]|nr:PadR family transcriptional regulator [candidate division GN15 bacterium]
MSIRHGILAILAEQPAHGYWLKSHFEEYTAGMWPLNVGQVYSTLARLERDGMVEPVGEDDAGRQAWRITPAGRAALRAWYDTPVATGEARDELAIKVLLAIAGKRADAGRIIDNQRLATMQKLQQFTRVKKDTGADSDLAWVLLLDLLTARLEAEINWLDRCEQRLKGAGR